MSVNGTLAPRSGPAMQICSEPYLAAVGPTRVGGQAAPRKPERSTCGSGSRLRNTMEWNSEAQGGRLHLEQAVMLGVHDEGARGPECSQVQAGWSANA